MALLAGSAVARADVTAVSGRAYGYFSNISLFGGPFSSRGPAPSVTLPPGGSAAPITATAPSASAQYGPATIFSSDRLEVSTQGSIGPSGSVTSSASINNVGKSGNEVFTATNVAGTCSASESGVTGSTTITNGRLQTSDGNPDVEGDETIVVIPTNPAPNTTYEGRINSVGDSFRYVFNEQIVNSDGSLTVNAAHQYFLGPTAVGELIIGQSVCGVTASPSASPSPTPTATPTPTPSPSPTPTATPTPTPTPTPTATPAPTPTPAQALNISTRLRVEVGDNVMIGGFIITGNEAKKVIIRALGPSLQEAGVADAVADPVLELRGSDGELILRNDNWRDTQQSDIEASTVPPPNDLESAIVAMLNPAAYTAVVTGKNETTGVGLIEVYDLLQSADSELANISTRGLVLTESNVMIGGFILGSGTGATKVVVRALGPSLGAAGIDNPLADPTLDLRDGNGERLLFNDNWTDDGAQAAELMALNLAPESQAEAAMTARVPPGTYTAIVAGKDGGIGVGLVELYNVK